MQNPFGVVNTHYSALLSVVIDGKPFDFALLEVTDAGEVRFSVVNGTKVARATSGGNELFLKLPQ